MDKPAQNIQDTFLNTVRKDKSPITIYLVSGVKLTGRIRSFDKYSVLLENNNQEQLIFKHAISTVVSSRSLVHGELRPNPVAIHVDRKSGILPELTRVFEGCPEVTFLPRHVCHWGLFGHVAASLEGLKWFLGTPCDYAILLTGQCYPLKSQGEIARDLANLQGRSVHKTLRHSRRTRTRVRTDRAFLVRSVRQSGLP